MDDASQPAQQVRDVLDEIEQLVGLSSAELELVVSVDKFRVAHNKSDALRGHLEGSRSRPWCATRLGRDERWIVASERLFARLCPECGWDELALASARHLRASSTGIRTFLASELLEWEKGFAERLTGAAGAQELVKLLGEVEEKLTREHPGLRALGTERSRRIVDELLGSQLSSYEELLCAELSTELVRRAPLPSMLRATREKLDELKGSLLEDLGGRWALVRLNSWEIDPRHLGGTQIRSVLEQSRVGAHAYLVPAVVLGWLETCTRMETKDRSELLRSKPAPSLLEAFATLHAPHEDGAFRKVKPTLRAARLL